MEHHWYASLNIVCEEVVNSLPVDHAPNFIVAPQWRIDYRKSNDINSEEAELPESFEEDEPPEEDEELIDEEGEAEFQEEGEEEEGVSERVLPASVSARAAEFTTSFTDFSRNAYDTSTDSTNIYPDTSISTDPNTTMSITQANQTFDSVHGGDILTKFPDCAIVYTLYVAGEAINHPRYMGFEVKALIPHSFWEMKRYPPRDDDIAEVTKGLRNHITLAKVSVLGQVAMAFLNDTTLQKVLAIACSGPFWTQRLISRNQLMERLMKLIATKKSYKNERITRTLCRGWGMCYRFYTPDSDRLLRKMVADMSVFHHQQVAAYKRRLLEAGLVRGRSQIANPADPRNFMQILQEAIEEESDESASDVATTYDFLDIPDALPDQIEEINEDVEVSRLVYYTLGPFRSQITSGFVFKAQEKEGSDQHSCEENLQEEISFAGSVVINCISLRLFVFA